MASVVSLPGTCRSITQSSQPWAQALPRSGTGVTFIPCVMDLHHVPRSAGMRKLFSSPTGFRPSPHQHHHPCLFTSCAQAPCRSFRSDRVPALVSKKMEAYTPHEEKMIFVAPRRLIYPSCFARLGLVQPRARLVQCR